MTDKTSSCLQFDLGCLVALVEEQFRVLAGGFAVEIALAWPVIGETVTDPVIVSAGSHDRVRVWPAQVFRHAIRRRADAVVLAHNHQADTGPSDADQAVTRRLVAAGHVIGVPLLAHLVVEPRTVYELVTERMWDLAAASLII